ncbi:hypothetical protein FGF92_23865, partial [Salmonella sp. gx-f5]|nr:hypothetical protein [Salmonella sp. gx-f5]
WGGLYFMQQLGSVPSGSTLSKLPVCSASLPFSIFEFWHNRLGHSSNSRMHFLNKVVPDFTV